MPAEIIPLRPTFDPVRVELTSPGTQGGRPFYVVDFVEAGGGRAGMWHGTDLGDAHRAARECGDCGDGAAIPVLDLIGPEPGGMPAGMVH